MKRICLHGAIKRELDLTTTRKPKATLSTTELAPTVACVAFDDRTCRLGQNPFTVWLTGLSSAGKTTIADHLLLRLAKGGHIAFVLDGDDIRRGLCRDLGFSPEDRRENIRRVAETARLMNKAGLIVIAALISPYRNDREDARSIIGPECFFEVFIDAPLEVCVARDVKGFYRRAMAGEIGQFTGVSAPYEPPVSPKAHLRTDRVAPEEAVESLMEILQAGGAFV